ncbi:helix-turn-helix transcriptional regulator [Lachnospiraceae bacterium OttesenSCG-928-D06]|nr:helix-turn-helix transcriptional regulator [Lachnospiraceae bacterium OttesenSCG-928-D06]
MNLREIRKNKGFSVPELSRLSSVPVRTIEDLERRGDGRVSTLIKLSDALDVSLDVLCREKKENPED